MSRKYNTNTLVVLAAEDNKNHINKIFSLLTIHLGINYEGICPYRAFQSCQ
ncbi:hypothetical protein VCR12J2_640082 [Vibrio coralliirubri]|nr:hypothetical protein VCR29J2_20094 [Vibrio coralliirubri]CDT65817.1 hypothetical protein VCR4J2_750416 [Vibrio coralliirubri]CDU04160.1 hypothetical protein VCR12J2_640082 [Vibrio coralliirubri]